LGQENYLLFAKYFSALFIVFKQFPALDLDGIRGERSFPIRRSRR